MTKENKEKLKSWRIQKIEECKQFPKYFYYFSLTDNLESIIDFGILPKNEIEKKKLLQRVLKILEFNIGEKLLIVLFQVEKIKKFMI